MKKVLRWIGFAFGVLAGLAVVAYAILYVLSERIMRRTWEAPVVALTIPTDRGSIEEGRRLAYIHGCFADCHGKAGEGGVLLDKPAIARLVAPNLTAAVRRYSDAQLAAIIRDGVRPNGRSVLAMPAEAFVGMSDAELVDIIAFLKSVPTVPGLEPSFTPGPLGRLGLVTGQFKTAAQLIADAVPPPAATNPQAERGRYLARTICAECHGTSLGGDTNPDFTSPDLRMVAAYSPEAFTRLMRTGIALGDRDLGIMSQRARTGLSHLTDAEIAALYSYLHAMPETAPAGG